MLWTNGNFTLNDDTIFVLDRGSRSATGLHFLARAGALPLSVELRATEAVLRALRG